MKSLYWFIGTLILSPYLWLRANLRRKKNIKKILLIHYGKIGDLVCAMRMFRAIKESIPDAEIHVLCRESSAAVLKENPFVDQMHFLTPYNRMKLIKKFRKERFDCSINCMPGAFLSLIGIWSFIPRRINSVTNVQGIIVRLTRIFQSKNIFYGLHMNTYKHYMKLVEAIRVRALPYDVDFFFTDADKNSVTNWLNEKGIGDQPFVVFSLTAGNIIKEWPEEKFAKLADYVTEEKGMKVILSTLDEGMISRVRSQTKNPKRVISSAGLNLGELGALCSKSKAFVSADTGPMYIAYGSGASVVIVIGLIDPVEQVPPVSNRCSHVMPPEGCKPWVFIANTPREGDDEQLRCVRDTSVEDVVEGLNKVLG